MPEYPPYKSDDPSIAAIAVACLIGAACLYGLAYLLSWFGMGL